MKVECDLVIEFDDSEKTKSVLESIKVDDFTFVDSKALDNKITAHIESKSVPSILHTIDDYLACISVAEKVLDKD